MLYWDMLLALDDVDMIDSCASGGHRLDLETMRRAVALHPTDFNYNDLPAKQIGSYGLASWVPLHRRQHRRSANYTTETKQIQYAPFGLSPVAHVCQVHLNNCPTAERKIVSDSENEWRNLSKFFYDNVYQLTNNTASVNEWYAYSYVNRKVSRALPSSLITAASSRPRKPKHPP